MKIVQTFWSGGRNPLEYSYGWPHAEYNLMSWTLSCLSLRRHYDRVELYTDRRGYELLIGKLHLPYTQVHVVYDDDLCLPQHWAYAKVKTYSLQTEPFLHIDGDMYFPKPLPEELLSDPLVAQNREIGTAYYQSMLNRVLAHSEFVLPDFIQDTLSRGTMASYNMGIFGGTDLEFIHRYCQQVFDFFEVNRMNDPSVSYSNEECNVLFEQIFLAAMVDKEGREVQGLHSQSVNDNGYFYKEFCNLREYGKIAFCHALGGLKRNVNICRLLAKNILRLYPSSYWEILDCFPNSRHGYIISGEATSEMNKYKAFVWNSVVKWNETEFETRKHVEEKSVCPCCSWQSNERNYSKCQLVVADNVYIYKVGEKLIQEDWELLHSRFGYPQCIPLKYIGVVCMSHRIGFEEVPLTEDDVRIILILKQSRMTIDSLLLHLCSSDGVRDDDTITRKRLKEFYNDEIKRLAKYNLLLLQH